MSRIDNIWTGGITNEWDNSTIDFEGLSMPGVTSVTITIPAQPVGLIFLPNAIVKTFAIEERLADATPQAAAIRIFGRRNGDNFIPYTYKNERWLLCNKLIIMNGTVMFLALPRASGGKLIIGKSLMQTCSPMAKILKEKMIPSLVSRGKEFIITNTDFIRYSMVKSPWNAIQKNAEEILLAHLDDLCN